jgi:hypothetical protein
MLRLSLFRNANRDDGVCANDGDYARYGGYFRRRHKRLKSEDS